MGGFSIFMFIFGFSVLLFGYYMYTGHKAKALLWRAPYQKLTKQEFINLGKWVMITSSIPFLLAILGIIFSW